MVEAVDFKPVLFPGQSGAVPGTAVRVLRQDQQALSLKGLSEVERAEYWRTYFEYRVSSYSDE